MADLEERYPLERNNHFKICINRKKYINKHKKYFMFILSDEPRKVQR